MRFWFHLSYFPMPVTPLSTLLNSCMYMILPSPIRNYELIMSLLLTMHSVFLQVMHNCAFFDYLVSQFFQISFIELIPKIIYKNIRTGLVFYSLTSTVVMVPPDCFCDINKLAVSQATDYRQRLLVINGLFRLSDRTCLLTLLLCASSVHLQDVGDQDLHNFLSM